MSEISKNIPQETPKKSPRKHRKSVRFDVEKRRALVPELKFDENLPIAAKREELVELIKQHQVVIIAGETGSGKTTQLPKICLEAGRGVKGKIGCTQPRRLAARSVASRIAEELESELGELVGYQVRFNDTTSPNNLIKVMTDGILLAEIQQDKLLRQYDTIIIDEAHERSLNIDFLLGILRQLLPQRPDLKVIITSATIDTQSFSEFFDGAPIVEVSGRTYPVELRYRPLESFELDDGSTFEEELSDGIISALQELAEVSPLGDVLVFLVGEREIREVAEDLNKANLRNMEILPLFARQSTAEQQKIFNPSGGKRRVILATNVAETSLTVPGIRFVIDPGYARISRYSLRSKVQRLPIERVSQASANQRKGRCGRVADGICIRLYSLEDFKARPEFTDPEIHRTSLAAVLLQMAQLNLGRLEDFNFIDPPENRAVNDAYQQLFEINALAENRQLTQEGRQLARIPVEPRIAKMILAGQKFNVFAETLVIAAALSIQDPRQINEDNQSKANKVLEKFTDPRSDFLFFLNLWHFYHQQQEKLSKSQLRRLCRTNYLSHLRMREWQDLHQQLCQAMRQTEVKVPDLHSYETHEEKGKESLRLSDLHSINLHRSLLTGLLSQVMVRDGKNNYLGTRSTQVFLHPSSILFKPKPKWIMSAELVETSRLYARTNAVIDHLWLEDLAGHLLKRQYSDPHWQARAGQVGAYETATLYGLPIFQQRRINYGRVNPKDARAIFITALSAGDVRTRARFYKHNQDLIEQIKEYETKLRKQDFLVDQTILIDFYTKNLPENIYSVPALEKWERTQFHKGNKEVLDNLYLTEDKLLKREVDTSIAYDFPDQIQLANNLPLKLDYTFNPTSKRDGVVFQIPLAGLNLVEEETFEWLTPGFLTEKVIAYIRALPKNLRTQFVPAPRIAERVLQAIDAGLGDPSAGRGVFVEQLVTQLNRLANNKVSIEDFAGIDLPAHLKPWFELCDPKGKLLAESGNLQELKQNYKHLVTAEIQQANDTEKQLVESWDFGDLETSKSLKTSGQEFRVYPGLMLEKEQVFLTLYPDETGRKLGHKQAVIELIAQLLADKKNYLRKQLNLRQACLYFVPLASCEHLTNQIIMKSLQNLLETKFNLSEILLQKDFETALELARLGWIEEAQNLAKLVSDILAKRHNLAKRLTGRINPRWLASVTDIQDQLSKLVSADFVLATPTSWLKQLPRYLEAIEVRLKKIDLDPQKDLQIQRSMTEILQKFKQLEAATKTQTAEFIELRWLLEELRISLFAQPMKTLQPISIDRLLKRLG